MDYLLLICSDGVATPEKAAAMRESMPGWLSEMDARGVRVFGHALANASAAKTVRVRGPRTFLSDGPFAETKEFVGGIDIVECADLDEAIEIAAKHPVARFHMIEIRPFTDGADVRTKVPTGETERGQRYLMFMCADGIPATDPEEEWVRTEGASWFEAVKARDPNSFGHALKSITAATTVRVREGQTLISDGPFAETREFIAGFDIVECTDLDEAVEIAAKHPLAAFHMVEVRPFARDEASED